jgi:hypothetical protein
MINHQSEKTYSASEHQLRGTPINRFSSVLIDANLLIDYYFDRPSMWLNSINTIMELIAEKKIKGYITESDAEKIWHLKDKVFGEEVADSTIDQINKSFTICKVSEELIEHAINNNFYNDFDCSLKSTIFTDKNLGVIITSRPFDSPLTTQDPSLNAQTPSEFVDNYNSFQLGTEEKAPFLKIGDWCISGFKVESLANEVSNGIVYYHNSRTGKRYLKTNSGKGAIEVLCQAVDEIISSEMSLNFTGYMLRSIKLKNRGEGVGAESYVETTLVHDSTLFIGKASSKNSVEAAFNAYINTISKIYQYHQLPPLRQAAFQNKRFLSINALIAVIYMLIYPIMIPTLAILTIMRMVIKWSIISHRKRQKKNQRTSFALFRGFLWLFKLIVNGGFLTTKCLDKFAVMTVEVFEDLFPQFNASTKLNRWFNKEGYWEKPFSESTNDQLRRDSF